MTKLRQRLHLSRLTSIGAVEAGDNPEADVLFWKARAGEGESAGSALPLPAEDLAAATLAKLDAQDRAITGIIESREALGQEIEKERNAMGRPAKTYPAGTIRAEVDRLAHEMIETGEAATLTEARPLVWKARPDLVAASRANTEGRTAPRVGPEPGTLPERIAKAVEARAVEMSALSAYFEKSAAARRVAVWKTPDGQRLRDLYTAATKDHKLSKSAASPHARAFETLARWEADPRADLR